MVSDMGKINWDLVPFFNRNEFDDPNYVGSGDCIDGCLLMMLVKLRNEAGWPIITHAKIGGAVDVDGSHGHVENSYHLKVNGCSAVDFHFDTDESTRLQYNMISRLGFGGVGIYYDWHWNNQLLPIGFHVDTRPKTITQRWIRENGEYFYLLK